MKANITKQKIIEEIRLFLMYAFGLGLFLSILTTYRRVILEQYSISYAHYGYSWIEALILAKIIMIGEFLGLGERYADRPLIIPILYKTLVFSVLVLFFSMAEHFIIGFFSHKPFEPLFHQFIHKGIYTTVVGSLIVYFAFFFFFAFLEMGRALGNKQLFILFFQRRQNIKNEFK